MMDRIEPEVWFASKRAEVVRIGLDERTRTFPTTQGTTARQPNYQALGFGSRDECEGRN